MTGLVAIVLLVVGLAHVDDVSPGNQRLGWAALAFAALLLILAFVESRHEGSDG